MPGLSPSGAPSTRATLLARLREQPENQMAWAEFVRMYQPAIKSWCRRWGMQDADADDATQLVLVRLAAKLPSFSYQPERSFRAWLRTVAHGIWHDHLHRWLLRGRGTGDSDMMEQMANLPAREDWEARLTAAYDRELTQLAATAVQARVAPQTWQAFLLTAIEGLSGAETAQRLGMPASHVYVARGRVQKLLAAEIQRLDAGESVDADNAV